MNTEVIKELEHIRQSNNGFLRPQEVVQWAENPASPLHSHFEWDDTEAAEKYRINQARALIRVAVIVDDNTQDSIRAYVSLTSDRNEEGGYRAMAEVVNDDMLMQKLLDDAINELACFQRKYESLRNIPRIASLFPVVDKVLDSPVVKQSENRASM